MLCLLWELGAKPSHYPLPWTERPLLLLLYQIPIVSPTGPLGPHNGSCQSFRGWRLLREGERLGTQDQQSCARWVIQCALFTPLVV